MNGGEERGKKEKRNKREAFIIISNRTPVKDFNSLLPKISKCRLIPYLIRNYDSVNDYAVDRLTQRLASGSFQS